ncbi:MAG: NTP transferase domain-containing protein [Candidatus Freyarchaeota archaeon]|nr:NTP transferase domain-containing protein [Candidatus Jordarchaeia archaeon]
MQAVIMAGGKGTRLRPLTVNIPKPIVPIVDVPMMEHTINLLKRHGVRDIMVTVSYLGDKIEKFFGGGSRYGVNISYSHEEEPLGTAGGVKLLEERIDGTFLVLSGDVLTDIDITRLVKTHEENDAMVTIALTRVDNPVAYGIAMVDENGRIQRFLEKPGWGEVFSDLVNTGTYVLEPEVFNYIPKGKEYDFSKDLFPRLLKEGERVFSYRMREYWIDIGNPQKYVQANQDILRGQVNVEIPHRQIREGVWVGEGTELPDACDIRPPVVIGRFCKVDENAVIDRFSVIGGGCYVAVGAVVSRSIVWGNTSIHRGAELRGCVVGARCEVGERTQILDGAVVGDDCIFGSGAKVMPEVYIWPGKVVEKNAIVNMNLKWGVMWKKSLFTEYGIQGLVNIEVTPEFATKLGAAFATHLGEGCTVVVGRDSHIASRMVKRAIVAGLQSAGVNVYNMKVQPVPIVEAAIRSFRADGGVFVSISQDDARRACIRLFDSNGFDLSSSDQKKVEDVFFKEDLKRIDASKVGDVVYPYEAVEAYFERIIRCLKAEEIRRRKMRVVLDCGDGCTSLTAPFLVRRLGCEVVTLNANIGAAVPKREHHQLSEYVENLAKTVRALDADLGVAFDNDGDQVLFVDDEGEKLSGDTATALLALSQLERKRGGKLVVPVTTSHVVEELAKNYGGEVVRVKLGFRPLVETLRSVEGVFGGDESGGYIIPDVYLFRDGLVGATKLLEFMALQEEPLSEIRKKIPEFYMAKKTVECPLEHRGAVMRSIMEETQGSVFDTIDGIKIYFEYGWVLIRPSSHEGTLEVFSEAKTREKAEELLESHVKEIEKILYEIKRSV